MAAGGRSGWPEGVAGLTCETVRRPACSRRRILAGLAGCGAAFLAGAPVAQAALAPIRALSFHSLHTGESLEVAYWQGGRYQPEALNAIDHHLRDFRTGEVHIIDVRLLDLLHALNKLLPNHAPLHVISGYRSPATNAMLAARSGNVAKKSYHMYGMAIDVRVPGCALKRLRAAALELAGGGVGYYPRDDFVHLDVGPVRAW
jgi:uncharacterized protein YcbK (DUF882 family)